MAVSLSPSDLLGFQRPLTQHGTSLLTITNDNSKPVAFKIKTTAPKLYCVRPNSGRIEPGDNSVITVIRQASRREPPLNVKCKHKFLIQSTIVTPERENMSPHEICGSPDVTEGGNMHQQRIRVSYLPALIPTRARDDATIASIIDRIPLLSDDSTFIPGSEPQPPENPHHPEEPSPPSHSDTCAVDENSGHAPHGRLPIAQEGEFSHPNESPFQISPEAALPAQPIPELAEPGSDEVRRSDLVFTPAVVSTPKNEPINLCEDEHQKIEPLEHASISTTAPTSSLHQNTMLPQVSAAATDVCKISRGVEPAIPLHMVIGVLVLAMSFSAYIVTRG